MEQPKKIERKYRKTDLLMIEQSQGKDEHSLQPIAKMVENSGFKIQLFLSSWYNKILAIRTGYFYEHATKGGRKYLTFGIGGRYAGLGLDLSYLHSTEERHPLQNTVRFTFLYEFGKHNKSAHKKSS